MFLLADTDKNPYLNLIINRLDRLLILLDTGSSTSVRTTAAKQLAQLAAKSVRSDVGGDDKNTIRLHGSLDDPSAWAELMSVVARVSLLQ